MAFYLGMPLALGVYAGLHNWQIQESAGYLGTITFYLAHSFIPWWATCLSSSFVMWALERIKPNPFVIMASGSTIGCIITLPYTTWITERFEQLWPSLSNAYEHMPNEILSGELFEYVVRVTLIWLIVNYVFDRFVGLPRYRYAIPRGYEITGHYQKSDHEKPVDAGPAFLSRLPVRLETNELVAIKAEQHYVRIFTAKRDYMILYRFSDAVSQLDTDLGMQVHRSWWVAHSAIQSLHQSGKKFFVLLSNDQEAPVSAPYQGLMKELARSRGIDIRPQPARASAIG